MDRIDRHILNLLQQDGRLTTAEIAEQVGLSPSPCARRLKRLESEQVIRGYQANLDRQKLNLGMTVFVNVRLSHHQEDVIGEFEQAVIEMREVISCHIVSGAHDYLLEVVSQDLVNYEQFIRKLQTLPMVKDINTNLAIRSVKSHSPLPFGE